jgi:small subunit ribosomal protein S9
MDQSIVDRLDILGLAEAEAELQGLPISEPADQWVGWGTHRSAVAKLVLRPGSGELRVNGQPVWDYFNEAPEKARIFLLRLLSTDIARQVLSGMEAVVVVRGSSPTTMQQAKSVAHALANALVAYDSECSDPLNRAGFGGRRIKYKEKF